MSIGKIVLIILAVLVAAVVVAGVVADQKFGIITTSPRVSHQTLVKPETRGIIAIDPMKAQDLVARFAEYIPAWILPRVLPVERATLLNKVLPFESAVLLNVDQVLSDLNFTAFINDQRLGPVICEEINKQELPTPLSDWMKEKMQVKERGVLVREGSTRMPRGMLTRIQEQWKDAPKVTEPLKLNGGHLVEAAFDNRDGSAIAIIASLVGQAGFFDPEKSLEPGQMGLLAAFQAIRLSIDTMLGNEVKIVFTIECDPAQPEMVSVLQMAVETGFSYVQPVAAMQSIQIDGATTVNGNIIESVYTIKDYPAILKRIPAA